MFAVALRRLLASAVLLLTGSSMMLVSGCSTVSAQNRAHLSAEVQHLTELRDTCAQYASWMIKDVEARSPEYREGMQLYIEASAAANAYVEALRFDLLLGASFEAERYAKISTRVSESSEKFVRHARSSLGIGKERGLPLLIIPAAMGLVDLAGKLNGLVTAASDHQRDLVARSLAETKWKTLQELKATPGASTP
jgi:hypothetical protein